MPRDVSSSSSEDEEENSEEETPTQHKPHESTKFQCPPDFVSFSHAPCRSTLTEHLKKKKNELWLIKAPSNFDPECFSGVKVPLSGLRTVKVPSAVGGATAASDQRIFSILASSHTSSRLRLLTGNKHSADKITFAPAFSGLINVCENFGDAAANMAPQVVPAAPAPSIPPGLKQRFQPFGCKAPTLTSVAESEGDGDASWPRVSKRSAEEEEEEEEDEGRKKKKKKKKEKRIKTEREEVEDFVKVEPEVQEEVMAEASEEKRKKKKKKKDREREEVEEGAEPNEVKVEEVAVKSEPMDTSYGDEVDVLVKKKKKKKKSERDDD